MLWPCSGQPGSRVKSFAVSSNGKVGVTVLFDSTISVWDLKTMQVRHMPPKIGLGLYPPIYKFADRRTPEFLTTAWEFRNGLYQHLGFEIVSCFSKTCCMEDLIDVPVGDP